MRKVTLAIGLAALGTPYHLLVAPWMMDNVRRAELVGGQGTAAPDFTFATIYRLRKWSQGRVTNVDRRKVFVQSRESCSTVRIKNW